MTTPARDVTTPARNLRLGIALGVAAFALYIAYILLLMGRGA